MRDMEKKYLELKEKFHLPSFTDLSRDFDVYDISDDDLLKEIVKKMVNVIDHYVNLLEDIIQPDSRFYSLKEANVLEKESRVVVNQIYNKLMQYNRASILLNLSFSEGDAANFINDFFSDWQLIKKELFPIFQELKNSWSKKTETKHDGGYFG